MSCEAHNSGFVYIEYVNLIDQVSPALIFCLPCQSSRRMLDQFTKPVDARLIKESQKGKSVGKAF